MTDTTTGNRSTRAVPPPEGGTVVTIPNKVGERAEFVAHGVRFTVRKLDRRTWTLHADGVERCRFGDRRQIAEDIAHAEQAGTLPPRSPNSWH